MTYITCNCVSKTFGNILSDLYDLEDFLKSSDTVRGKALPISRSVFSFVGNNKDTTIPSGSIRYMSIPSRSIRPERGGPASTRRARVAEANRYKRLTRLASRAAQNVKDRRDNTTQQRRGIPTENLSDTMLTEGVGDTMSIEGGGPKRKRGEREKKNNDNVDDADAAVGPPMTLTFDPEKYKIKILSVTGSPIKKLYCVGAVLDIIHDLKRNKHIKELDVLIDNWWDFVLRLLKSVLPHAEITRSSFEEQLLNIINDYIESSSFGSIYKISSTASDSPAASNAVGANLFTFGSKNRSLNCADVMLFLKDGAANPKPLDIYVDTNIVGDSRTLLYDCILEQDVTKRHNVSDIFDASGCAYHCKFPTTSPPRTNNCTAHSLKNQIETFESGYRHFLDLFDEGRNIVITLAVSNKFISTLNNKCAEYVDVSGIPKNKIFQANGKEIYFRLTIEKKSAVGAAMGGAVGSAMGAAAGAAGIEKRPNREDEEMEDNDTEAGEAAGAAGAAASPVPQPCNLYLGKGLSLNMTLFLLARHLDSSFKESNKAETLSKGYDIKILEDIIDALQKSGLTPKQITLILISIKAIGDESKIWGSVMYQGDGGTKLLVTNDRICYIQRALLALQTIIDSNTLSGATSDTSNHLCLLGTENNSILFKCANISGNLCDMLTKYYESNIDDQKYSLLFEEFAPGIGLIRFESKEKQTILSLVFQAELWTTPLDQGDKKEKIESYNFYKKLIEMFLAMCNKNENDYINDSIDKIESVIDGLEKKINDLMKQMDAVHSESTNGNPVKPLSDDIKKKTDEILDALVSNGAKVKDFFTDLVQFLGMIDDTIYNADFGTAIKKLIERSNNIYKKIAIRTTELIKNYHRSNDKIKSIVITSGRGARAQEADLRSLKDVIADSLVEFLDFARQHNSNLVEHAKMQIQIEHSNDPTVIDIAAETKEDLEYYKKKNTNALGILLSKASEWINDYLIHSQHSSRQFSRQFSRQLSRQHSHSTPGPGEDSTKKLLDEAAKRLSSQRSLNREDSDSSAVSTESNTSESLAKLQEKIDEVSSYVLGPDQLSVPSVKKIKAVGAIMPSQPSSPAAGASLSASLSGSLSRTLSSPSVSSWKWMMSQSPVMDGSQLSRQPSGQPSMESLRRAPSGVGSMGAASGREMFRIDERGESGQEADKQSNAVESASSASASASASGTEKDSSMQEGGGKVKKIKKQNKAKNIAKSKSSNVKILRLNKPTKDTKKPSKDTKKPSKTTTKKPSKTTTKKPSKTTTKKPSKTTTKKPSKDNKKPTKDTKKPTKSNTKTTSKPTTKKPTKILNKKTNKFKIIKFKH